MDNAGDFIIENGVLVKYTGRDTDVTIPEGVTAIGNNAFYGCENLTIHAPRGSAAIQYAEKYKIPFVAE